MIIRIEKKIRIRLLLWLHFPISLLLQPFLSLSPNLSSLLPFLISPFIFLFSSSLISLLSSPLARLFTSLFAFPLSALPVPCVQELTLASLTRPLLGALRAAIGIKYSFISFIMFILIRLSLNKSLIKPYY